MNYKFFITVLFVVCITGCASVKPPDLADYPIVDKSNTFTSDNDKATLYKNIIMNVTNIESVEKLVPFEEPKFSIISFQYINQFYLKKTHKAEKFTFNVKITIEDNKVVLSITDINLYHDYRQMYGYWLNDNDVAGEPWLNLFRGDYYPYYKESIDTIYKCIRDSI